MAEENSAVNKLTGADDFLSRVKTTVQKESLPETRGLMAEGVTRSAEAKGEIKRQQDIREQKIAAGEGRLLASEAMDAENLRQQARQEREQKRPVFEPTKENFQDFAAVFAGLSALTFLVGGKGRGAGMAGLSALNGAMEGWNKGKKDVYEKNIKEYKAKLDEYKVFIDEQARDLTLALEIGGKKTAAGRALLKEIVLKDNGGMVSAEIESEKYQGAMKVLQNAATGLQQVRNIEARAAATAANKAANLSPKEKKEKVGAETLLSEMKRLKSSFKDAFANQKFDTVGELRAWMNDRFRKDPAMAAWWKAYENVALPERHAMFGATLTGGERDAWRKATIGSGDSTALIKNWFDERIRLLENKLDQYDKVNDSRNRPNRDDNPLELEL